MYVLFKLLKENNKSEEEEIGPKPAEAIPEPEPLTRDDSWRKTTPSTREWDRGKHSMYCTTEHFAELYDSKFVWLKTIKSNI